MSAYDQLIKRSESIFERFKKQYRSKIENATKKSKWFEFSVNVHPFLVFVLILSIGVLGITASFLFSATPMLQGISLILSVIATYLVSLKFINSIDKFNHVKYILQNCSADKLFYSHLIVDYNVSCVEKGETLFKGADFNVVKTTENVLYHITDSIWIIDEHKKAQLLYAFNDEYSSIDIYFERMLSFFEKLSLDELHTKIINQLTDETDLSYPQLNLDQEERQEISQFFTDYKNKLSCFEYMYYLIHIHTNHLKCIYSMMECIKKNQFSIYSDITPKDNTINISEIEVNDNVDDNIKFVKESVLDNKMNQILMMTK